MTATNLLNTSSSSETSKSNSFKGKSKANSECKTDIKQEITNQIIAMLEQGAGKFKQMWVRGGAGGMPMNGKTGEFYNGVNVLLLWMSALGNGFHSNVWLTFKQAQSLGAKVIKGSSGTRCVYFKNVSKPQALEDGETGASGYTLATSFYLFNLEQLEGEAVQALLLSQGAAKSSTDPFKPIDVAEKLILACGADVVFGGIKAQYSPSVDKVFLPDRERFTSPENFYAVCLHELTHWTGHTSRLNRGLANRFGSEAYAVEELIAELGSAFLAGHLGFVDATLESHVSYLDNWLKVLRSDKSAIFTASKHAGAATNYILGKLEELNSTV